MNMDDALLANKQLVDEIGHNDAYLILAVALFLEEPDLSGLAATGLTEGGNDKKIDFIYHDVDARRLVFAQGYMSGTQKADSAPANKASDLNTACAWLLAGDVNLVPQKLRDIIVACRQAIEQGEVDFIDLLYVHNLPESVNVSRELQTAEEYLRSNIDDERVLVKSHEFGRSKIQHLLAAQDSHIEVMDKIPLPTKLGIIEKGETWTAAVTTIPGNWVHDLYSKYGDKLYSANYRGFLGVDGRKRVNLGIRESVEKTPVDFWAFNNGITILTLKLDQSKKPVELSGISIINGAQTTGSIGSVDANKAKLSEVRVLCRVIECSDQATIDKIVKFNNTQNVITTWDQFSNDQEQRRIGDEFAELGFSYSRKRGFTGGGDQIGIEQVLQPLLAYHGRPQDASRGKNQLFIQKQLYHNAFEGKKARHILFVHALSRAIDAKRLEMKAKSSVSTLIAVEEKQVALLRNLFFKSFLLSVVANSLETIVGVPCDPMTVGFKPQQAKNTTVAELSARWIPVVETILPILTAVVEPDTFFRNLSEEAFMPRVKSSVDAMLTAMGAADKHKTFSDMIAPS